jgi:uncharacterized protein (TIGR03084 family)
MDARDRVAGVAGDLRDEHAALDERVAGLDEAGWSTATPAQGWSVRDQISHLTYFDETARLALVDPDAFTRAAEELLSGASFDGDVAIGRSMAGAELLERWRSSRAALFAAVDAADPTARVPWYGPAMSLASFVTARMMETWAHGQDVADALGLPPVVSDRLRNVCHIGVGARAYAFLVHGMEDPGAPVFVAATSPGGEVWTWGAEDAADRIEGSALDLALVFTQRRHRDDVSLQVVGPVADQWLSIAQAYAGPAGTGREPGMAL